MNERPTTLYIGPYEWLVVWGQPAKKRLGVTDPDRLTITISTAVPDGIQRTTLLHEILHAIDYVTGRYFAGPMPDELSIRTQAPLLYDALRRNPEVFEWIRS